MSKKYYFENEDSEMCFPLSYFKKIKEPNQNEITLFEADQSKDDTFFWCGSVGEVSETGCCGKFCSDYKPKNGKSGMCKFKRKIYEHGKKSNY